MKVRLSHLVVMVLMTAITSSWFTTTIVSQSPVEKARNRAVKVSQGFSGCSGTILQANLVMTNAHCVNEGRPVKVGDREGKVIKRDAKIDLALIIVETIVIDRVILQDAPATTDVFSFGFPMQSPNVFYTKGYVTVCQFDVCYADLISLPGSSGSGVYNQAGQLVGIISGYTADGKLAVFVPIQDIKAFWVVS